MKKLVHINDEVFIPAQHGWEQMQLLLDKNLPVKNQKPTRGFYVRMLVAACLVAVLLFSTLVLNNYTIVKLIYGDVNHAGANTQVTNKGNEKVERIHVKSTYFGDVKIAARNVSKSKVMNIDGVSPDLENLAVRKVASPNVLHEVTDRSVMSPGKEIKVATHTMIALPKDTLNKYTMVAPEIPGKGNRQRTWSLSAGLVMNTMIGRQQNFRPYPAAVLRYDLSNKFFLSLGLSAGSPVATENRGVKKTVYVNDMANNIQFYNEVLHYNNLVYADIPLLAGVNIGKKIALQAGLQASALLKAESKTIIEQYDYQMRMASGGPSSLVAGTAAPVNEIDRSVDNKKIDFRFTSGIKYTVNQVAFNLMYQYGLQPVLSGEQVSRNKTQLVSLGVQFKIK